MMEGMWTQVLWFGIDFVKNGDLFEEPWIRLVWLPNYDE